MYLELSKQRLHKPFSKHGFLGPIIAGPVEHVTNQPGALSVWEIELYYLINLPISARYFAAYLAYRLSCTQVFIHLNISTHG